MFGTAEVQTFRSLPAPATCPKHAKRGDHGSEVVNMTSLAIRLGRPDLWADEFGGATPSRPAVRGVDGERIAYLTSQQEARLLASYSRGEATVMLCSENPGSTGDTSTGSGAARVRPARPKRGRIARV